MPSWIATTISQEMKSPTWDFPCPSCSRPSKSQIAFEAEYLDPFELPRESSYSLVLSTNIFVNLIALGAFVVQIYLFAGLGSLQWLGQLFTPSVLESPKFGEGAAALKTQTKFTAHCFRNSTTNENIPYCVPQTEEVNTEAFAVSIFILLLNLLPGLLTGIQLFIIGWCDHDSQCFVAGFLHFVVGMISINGGCIWAIENSKLEYKHGIHPECSCHRLCGEVDEQVYSIVTLLLLCHLLGWNSDYWSL
jgi:hypothetical protein